MKKTINFALGLCFLIMVLVNILTIKDGHNWGGDFSQYIINAQNILNLRPYNSGIMLKNPFNYPPGFSFLLAPIIKIFGVNFKILKCVNIVLWYSTIALLFPIFCRRLDKHFAFLCCLLLAVSSGFFTLKQNIISDIPFFFFVTVSLILFTKYHDQKGQKISSNNIWSWIAYCGSISFAFFMRSAGLSLFMATFFYCAVIKRNVRLAMQTLLLAFLVMAIQFSFAGSQSSFISLAWQDPLGFGKRMILASSLPLQSLLYFICPPQSLFTNKLYIVLNQVCIYISPVIYIAAVTIFIIKVKNRSLSFLGCFTFFYLFMLIVWSGFGDSVEVFARMTLPLLGVGLLISIELILFFSKKFLVRDKAVEAVRKSIKFALFMIILLNIFNIIAVFDFNDDVLLAQENQELFVWVKDNIGPNEYYMFWKSRPMALMTGRVGTSPWTRDPQTQKNFIQRIHRLDISYLILIKKIDGALIEQMEWNQGFAQPVWENVHYKIFKINK